MSRKIRVLVVDDDAVLRKLVSDQVARMGFDSTPAASGEEALGALARSDFDVMLLDIRMPGLSGLDTLREVRRLEDPPEVIMLTADTSLGTGIEAMRLGAYDYLTKPATLDEIEAVVRKADEKRRLVRQNASLRDAVRPAAGDEPLHGRAAVDERRGVFAGGGPHGVSQARVLADEPALLVGLADDGLDLVERRRLRQVVVGAEPHRLYPRAERRVGREHYDFGRVLQLPHLAQGFEAGEPRHPNV